MPDDDDDDGDDYDDDGGGGSGGANDHSDGYDDDYDDDGVPRYAAVTSALLIAYMPCAKVSLSRIDELGGKNDAVSVSKERQGP